MCTQKGGDFLYCKSDLLPAVTSHDYVTAGEGIAVYERNDKAEQCL